MQSAGANQMHAPPDELGGDGYHISGAQNFYFGTPPSKILPKTFPSRCTPRPLLGLSDRKDFSEEVLFCFDSPLSHGYNRHVGLGRTGHWGEGYVFRLFRNQSRDFRKSRWTTADGSRPRGFANSGPQIVDSGRQVASSPT